MRAVVPRPGADCSVTSPPCARAIRRASARPRPTPPVRRVRLPSARVAALVGALVGRHGATRLLVLDEMLNASEAHLDGLLDAVEAQGARFDVPNGVRADRLRGDQIRRMRGRITTLSVSAESGVQRVVDDHAASGCVAVIALRSGKVGYDEYLAVLDGLRDRLDVRDVLARDHGLPVERVTVHAMRLGGAFGGRTLATVEREAAWVARAIS